MSARRGSDAQVGAVIRASVVLSDRTYGARRVLRDGRAAGHAGGLHRVERRMRQQALRARLRRRALPSAPGAGAPHAVAPNVLDRPFTATAPNQQWGADFPDGWTQEGWRYVAVVLALVSRRVVGGSMQPTRTTQLVAAALTRAGWRRGHPNLLWHPSAQGSQYTSEPFQRVWQALGAQCRMSRSGNGWDKAVMERFFSTRKTERTSRKAYGTRNAARADIFDGIERFSHPIRRHSTRGYVSPADVAHSAA